VEKADAWRMTDRLGAEHGKGDPFAAAIRGTRMPMLITDPRQHDNPIVFANDAFLVLTGYERDEVMGRNCRFLQGEGTDPAAVDQMRAAIRHEVDINLDILNYRKDGTPFWNALYLSPVTNEAGELRYFFASQLDVTERKEAELQVRGDKDAFEREVARRTQELQRAMAELRGALEAKTVLLHEVDHRVKNNLQLVSSLIYMQSREIPDPAIKASLRAMLSRIEALGTVHRRLYQSDDVSRFDVADFARDVVGDLVGATGRTDIRVNLDLEPVEVPAEKAAPVALMLNELVTNALKHAFDGRPGTLDVAVRRNGHDFFITVADDGAGMADGALAKRSFGRTLVETLGRQLQARTEWSATGPGTRVEVALPIEQMRQGSEP
jgi:PAS domain S-box-containing protein